MQQYCEVTTSKGDIREKQLQKDKYVSLMTAAIAFYTFTERLCICILHTGVSVTCGAIFSLFTLEYTNEIKSVGGVF